MKDVLKAKSEEYSMKLDDKDIKLTERINGEVHLNLFLQELDHIMNLIKNYIILMIIIVIIIIIIIMILTLIIY